MKQVARGNQILAVSNSIFWQENLAFMSSASQVLMALKKSRSERMERKDRKGERKRKSFPRSISGKKYYLFTFFPPKNLCNFEQLRWNVMIKTLWTSSIEKRKKFEALIDKFFPKEYKNTHAYKSALEIVEYSKFW